MTRNPMALISSGCDLVRAVRVLVRTQIVGYRTGYPREMAIQRGRRNHFYSGSERTGRFISPAASRCMRWRRMEK